MFGLAEALHENHWGVRWEQSGAGGPQILFGPQIFYPWNHALRCPVLTENTGACAWDFLGLFPLVLMTRHNCSTDFEPGTWKLWQALSKFLQFISRVTFTINAILQFIAVIPEQELMTVNFMVALFLLTHYVSHFIYARLSEINIHFNV